MTLVDEVVTVEGRIAPARPGLATDVGLRDSDGGFTEVFAAGCFRTDQAQGRPLLWGHDIDNPVGLLVKVERRADGWWWAVARLSRSPEAQVLLTRLENGTDLSLSPGFRDLIAPINHGGIPVRLVEHAACNIGEVSILPTEDAAYKHYAQVTIASRVPRASREDVLAQVSQLRSASGLPPSPATSAPKPSRGGDGLHYSSPVYAPVGVI